jgi:hypothetical protein
MKPSGDGRFCDSCALVVVDFTKMTTEEINNYFLRRSDERVCGNYKNEQISTPKLVRRRKRWGWLITTLTIIFGSTFISSCRKPKYTQSAGVRVFQFAPQKTPNQQDPFPTQKHHNEKNHQLQ